MLWGTPSTNSALDPEKPFLSPGQSTDKKKTTPAPTARPNLEKSPGLHRGLKSTLTDQPQVRFLWRFDRERFLRLCCEILRRRFFLRLPMINFNEAGTLRILPRQVKPFSKKYWRGP